MLFKVILTRSCDRSHKSCVTRRQCRIRQREINWIAWVEQHALNLLPVSVKVHGVYSLFISSIYHRDEKEWWWLMASVQTLIRQSVSLCPKFAGQIRPTALKRRNIITSRKASSRLTHREKVPSVALRLTILHSSCSRSWRETHFVTRYYGPTSGQYKLLTNGLFSTTSHFCLA
jgi:hypothetical protein